jgi:hypothetical protein
MTHPRQKEMKIYKETMQSASGTAADGIFNFFAE